MQRLSTASSLWRHFSSLRPRHIFIFSSHAGINLHSAEATLSLTAVRFCGGVFLGDPGWPTLGKLDSRIPVPLRKASALPVLTPWQQPGSVPGVRFLVYSTFPDSFPLTVARVLSPWQCFMQPNIWWLIVGDVWYEGNAETGVRPNWVFRCLLAASWLRDLGHVG